MEEEFRPGAGRVLTVVVAIGACACVVLIAATTGVGDALVTLPWMLLLVILCWAFFWRPCVAVSDAGVRFVNVTHTVFLPWPAIRAVDTRFALRLTTEFGRYSAWAAPAAGAGSAVRAQMRLRSDSTDDRSERSRHDGDRDDEENGSTGSVAAGDLAGTPSGDAAAMVRRRWTDLRSSGFLDDPKVEHGRAPVTWHWRTGLLVAALATWCGATVIGS